MEKAHEYARFERLVAEQANENILKTMSTMVAILKTIDLPIKNKTLLLETSVEILVDLCIESDEFSRENPKWVIVCCEKHIHKYVHNALLDQISLEFSEYGSQLKKQFKRYHWITGKNLDLTFDLSRDTLEKTRVLLKKLQTTYTPSEKIACLIDFWNLVSFEVSRHVKCPNPESLLPAIILALVYSIYPSIVFHIKYIYQYSSKLLPLSKKADYVLTNIKSAIFFIYNLSPSLITTTDDEIAYYSAYVFGDYDNINFSAPPTTSNASSIPFQGDKTPHKWIDSLFNRADTVRKKAGEKLSLLTNMVNRVTKEFDSDSTDYPLSELNDKTSPPPPPVPPR